MCLQVASCQADIPAFLIYRFSYMPSLLSIVSNFDILLHMSKTKDIKVNKDPCRSLCILSSFPYTFTKELVIY